MCLARVYLDHNENDPFAQSVTEFAQNGDELTFTTIFGEQKKVAGTIENIDFTESIINVAKK